MNNNYTTINTTIKTEDNNKDIKRLLKLKVDSIVIFHKGRIKMKVNSGIQ